MSKTDLQSTTHGGGRVLSVILAGTLAFGMTPAVALTSQSLDPVQAFAAEIDLSKATISFSGAGVTGDAASGYSATYTGDTFSPTVTGLAVGTYSVKITKDGADATIKNQGTYSVTVEVAGEDGGQANTATGTAPVVSFTVNQAPLSIAATGTVTAGQSMTEAADAFTVTGVKADEENVYTVTCSIDGNTSATAAEGDTVKAVVALGSGANGNYTLPNPNEATTIVQAAPKTNLETLSTLAVSYQANPQATAQTLVRNQMNTIVLAPGTTQQAALAALAGQITVVDDQTQLTVEDDYTISTAAGAITITGAGDYEGWVQYPFEFVYGFGDTNVTITAGEEVPYDGASHVPTLRVIDPATNQPTTKYTVAYQVKDAKGNWVAVSGQPTNAGEYKAIVSLAGYTQTAEKEFEITPQNLAVQGFYTLSKIADIDYTGDPLAIPDVTVTVNYGTKDNPRNVVLTKGVDYTVAVVNAADNSAVAPQPFEAIGSYKLQITGKGNYAGVADGQTDPTPIYTDAFEVKAPSIANATVEVLNADKLLITKDVKSVQPELKVTLNGKELKQGTDFTVTPPTITKAAQNIVLTLAPANGITSFTGTKTVTIDVKQGIDTITSADLANPTVKMDGSDVNNAVEYGASGSKAAPITVMDGQSKLVEGVDYSITYGANTGAGPEAGTFTLKGIGNNWGGTYEGTYAIKGTTAIIKNLKTKPVTYNGTAQNAADFISFEVWALDDITDTYVKVDPSEYGYEIRTNTEFKDAGTYTYTIQLTDCPYDVSNSANSGETGAVAATQEITIKPLDITTLEVTPSQESYLITLDKNEVPVAVKPTFTIPLNGAQYTLTANDATFAYETAAGAEANLASSTGTITATITGNHNFTGECEATFDIYNSIANLYPAAIAAVTYNGQAQTPAVKLFVNKADAADPNTQVAPVPQKNGVGNNGVTNYTVSYEDNINAGTGKIIVTGTPNANFAYAGTLEIPFTINKAAATIAVADIADVTYTGSAITPEPKATITAGTQTVASTFAYSYANNVNAGTATVTVVPTGVGANYDVAATTKSFKINAANMSAVAYAGDTKVAVGKQPTIKLTYNGKELVAGTDYDVTETPVTSKAGKATLKVTGKGNFTGVKTIEITVEDASTPVNPDKPTTTEGWKHNATGWWYETGEGSYVTSAWKEINGNWYYFNKSGYMMTGWQKINGTWYYLNKKGEGTEGAMVSNAWKKINGTWYHFAKSGAMQTGWQKINGAWYYMAASGAMQTGWIKDGGTWYYLLTAAEGTEGKMVANQWKQINGSWFYFYASGAMAANTWVGNYWVDANGYWVR